MVSLFSAIFVNVVSQWECVQDHPYLTMSLESHHLLRLQVPYCQEGPGRWKW
jgi:hypothetical protein